MRAEFAAAMLEIAANDERVLFLSGDLGFAALEQLRDAIGDRFINAGVAEQNMVSVAAGLASKGFIPITYSIAPFATLRPYEQIRNDVCLHGLPVKVVGNGGGYGYGIMGSTHHALEDIGAMRMLPGMRVFVPALQGDVSACVKEMISTPGPAYLRLGKAVPRPTTAPSWHVWRKFTDGSDLVAVTIGPVMAELLTLAGGDFKGKIECWGVGEMPFGPIPQEFLASLERVKRLLVVEEHYSAGGLSEALSKELLGRLNVPVQFTALTAGGYPSGRYGSQLWHQIENSLAGAGLVKAVEGMCGNGG